MSKRTRNLLIIAVVLFLCCFGGSIGNPFRSDNDSGSNPIVDFLGNFASKGTAVPDSAIRADPPACRSGPNTFQFTGSCTLTVTEGGTGLRNLILKANRTMQVSSKVPRKDFTVSDQVDPGEEVKVAIDEGGGTVVLTCSTPVQTCVVTRGDGS